MENKEIGHENQRKEIKRLENGDYELGNSMFYPEEMTLYTNGNKVKLQPQSARILLAFLQARRHFLKKADINRFTQSNNPETNHEKSRIDMAISRLKNALCADPWLQIECEIKSGYRLCVGQPLDTGTGHPDQLER